MPAGAPDHQVSLPDFKAAFYASGQAQAAFENLGWPPHYTVSVIARQSAPGAFTPQVLLQRLARVSQFEGIKYWSTTRQQWRDLIIRAHALTSSDREAVREDFSPDWPTGSTRYFWQEENSPADALVYAATLDRNEPDCVSLSLYNPQTVYRFALPAITPGNYRAALQARRTQEGGWEVDYVMRLETALPLLAGSRGASFINRAQGLLHYLVSGERGTRQAAAP